MSLDDAAKLATPRRTTPMQVLSALFRTPTRLCTPTTVGHRNKRPRTPMSTPSTPSSSSLPAVVLQTYSVSTDSIILTTLPSAPFCCHEDLLTMSRAQLEAVVHALNARLPRRMHIGPEDNLLQDDVPDRAEECGNGDDGLSRMSEAEMKRRVEELVGIRAVVGKNRVSRSGLGLATRIGVPPTPRAVRTRDVAWRPCKRAPWEMEFDASEDPSDEWSVMIEDALMGSSPLASRSNSGLHVRGRNNTLHSLAILQEENEGSEPKEDDSGDNETRPSKRQRVSLGSYQFVHEVGESRLIENMDLSGSLLLAGDDASLGCFTGRDERAGSTTLDLDHTANMSSEGIQAPVQRRRSARIKEIAKKRMSLVDKAASKDLKSAILRSKTFYSRRFAKNISTSEGSDTDRDSTAPREFTIRLPFTTTPPQQKPESSVWSAPRILRSHSQRLQNSRQSTNVKASLGRSKSEKYPRASDLAFVTINRPRYRFVQRTSKGARVAKEDQASRPSASPEPGAHQLQESIQIGMEYSNKNEDDVLEVTTGNSGTGNLSTFPSAVCNLMAPRSRAPSTSTAASTRGSCCDSPARITVREGVAPTVITDPVVSDGAAERVWEALGRMAVDSV